jgi:hypothetical protein
MLSKLAKSANMTKKILSKLLWGIKNTEFYADSKFIEMGSKQCPEKSYRLPLQLIALPVYPPVTRNS